MIALLRPLEKMWWGEVCKPIVIPLGTAELELRLKKQLPSLLSSVFRRGLTGRVANGRLSVFWNTPGFGNAWRPVFHGVISGNSLQSQIDGRFSAFRSTQIFCAIWFGFVPLFAVAAIATRADLATVLAVPGMFIAGIALVAFGQFLSRSEKEKILLALRNIA